MIAKLFFFLANEKIAELLIKIGAEVNAKSRDGANPLHNAAVNSRYLLNQRTENRFLFYYFCQIMSLLIVGNEKVAELLIKHGANVNDEDNAGITPIFYAVSNGNQAVGSLLEILELSESYSKKMVQKAYIKHFTQPLHKHAGEKIVELLLDNGANINKKAKDGKTPYKQSDELGKTHSFCHNNATQISSVYLTSQVTLK